ncbi:MAG TPA: hypothetical protein VH419_16840 [Nocardioidaceae bacterium]
MAKKRHSSASAEHLKQVAAGHDAPDYSHLPTEIDPDRLVETHDVEPSVPEPRSVWATPDLADMARTNAIGGVV